MIVGAFSVITNLRIGFVWISISSALGLAGQGPAEEAHGAAKDLAKDLAMWLVLHWVALGAPLKGQKTRWLYELG